MTPSLSNRKRWLDPMRFGTNIAFVLLATLFVALASWLMHSGIISSLTETTLSQRYSPWNTFLPLKLWMQLALVLTIVLPICTLFLQWRIPTVRRMMALYFLVLLAQILTEKVVNSLGLSGMQYLIGFTYTSYRIWQLWCYRQCFYQQENHNKIRQYLMLAILVGGLIFWSFNWLFLAINLVTRIL